MASPDAKDVQFGHWLSAHALLFTGFRLGAGIGGTAGAEFAYILLMFIYILKVCWSLTLGFNRLSLFISERQFYILI